MNAATCPAISLAILVAGMLGLAVPSSAQVATQRQPAATAAAATRPGGPAWASLSAAQQQALAPLQREWPSIDASRKAKWLEIASRFPYMPAEERARVQQRMAEWSKLSPNERAEARIQFQQTRQFAPDDRQAGWDAYQALPEEARRDLARRAAKPLSANASANGATAAKPAPRPAGATPPSAKQNIVEPPKAVTPKLVTPTIVQSKPGATTTLLSQPANPPMHQQSGLPKISATKEFVQPNTLLPKRGPQGAAVRSAAAASGIPVQ